MEWTNPNGQEVNLHFSHEAYMRLQALKEKVSAETNLEVIRNALRLYEWYATKIVEGEHLALVRDGDIVREIKLEF